MISKEVLIKIADKLDKAGFKEEVDYIDSVIEKMPDESDIEIPEDEMRELKNVLESLKDSLGE